MIENISQNTRQTSKTLEIDGMARNKAVTTTYLNREIKASHCLMNNTIILHTRIPSNLDNALNGRKARSVLIDLNAGTSATPNISRRVPATLTKTIIKSNLFQPSLKYFFSP